MLRASFTPRRWPRPVTREFAGLSAIVVRRACTAHPWPARSSHDGLERAVAQHLARLLSRDALRTSVLRRRASRLMASALTAYERARSVVSTPAPKTPTATL